MVADAVADPGAVVVHLGDTHVAYAAVVRPHGLPVAALLAVHGLLGWYRLRDDLGPLEGGHSVREQSHENEEVEENFHELEVHLVCHPFVHLKVHQVDWHCIESDDDEAHSENESSRYHVTSEDSAEQRVAKHAHVD